MEWPTTARILINPVAKLNRSMRLSTDVAVVAALVGKDGPRVPVARTFNQAGVSPGVQCGVTIVPSGIMLDQILRVNEK